jgi:hypothetical protein
MTSQPAKPAAGGRVTVHLPADLRPVYTNFALITHSVAEFVIDLAQVMPQVPQARVLARAIMTPMNAKLLLRALNENVAKYETQHGTINVPEGVSLADQLFRPAPGDPPAE